MYVLKITISEDFIKKRRRRQKIVDNQCVAIVVIKIHLTALAGNKNNST